MGVSQQVCFGQVQSALKFRDRCTKKIRLRMVNFFKADQIDKNKIGLNEKSETVEFDEIWGQYEVDI